MIKQSKLSKICWALVYLLPLIMYLVVLWQDIPVNGAFFTTFGEVFGAGGLPLFNISFFSSGVFSSLYPAGYETHALIADYYLGYLVFVSLFRIVWKVLVYLPDVIGKLIDRWSL